MNINGKRILITGITGFTGRPLETALIKNGANVFGLTNEQSKNTNSQHLLAALEDKAAIDKAVKTVKPDFIIHLAGISFANHSNPLPYYQINVVGTENLLQACLKYAPNVKKIILASSAAVYGDSHTEFTSETQILNPISHYGCSKLAMELIAKTYMHRLPILMTRPFNYTGPRQPDNFLIPKIIKHFKERKKIIELGNTSITREFSDIRDIVSTYIDLLGHDVNGIINLCSGKAYTFVDILKTLTDITNHEIKVRVNPKFVRATDIERLVGNPQKLETVLGQPYKYNLEQTLITMLGASEHTL